MVAYPPNWWDSKTMTMQPHHINGRGTQKIGALYVDCLKFEFVLIFGVTWGQVPWCAVKPLKASGFRTGVADKQNGMRLEHMFNQFSETEPIKQPIDIVLCEESGLYVVPESVTVSGREMYIIRVEDSSEEMLEGTVPSEPMREDTDEL